MTTHQTVREALAQWLAAFNARDLEALMALYDDEIVYTNASAPLRRGKSEVRASFEAAFAGTKLQLLFREESSFEGRDLAHISGQFHFRLGPKGQEAGGVGRVALLWRRDDCGLWRLLFDTDNQPPDVSAAAFTEP